MAEGNLTAAYDIATFTERQSVLAGFNGTQLLWSYPPTFDLVIAPLGYLPAWLAYPMFMTATLALFIWFACPAKIPLVWRAAGFDGDQAASGDRLWYLVTDQPALVAGLDLFDDSRGILRPVLSCCSAHKAWGAFIEGVSATGDAFQNNTFTIFRMSSVYAFGLSIGLEHGVALLLHGAMVMDCACRVHLSDADGSVQPRYAGCWRPAIQRQSTSIDRANVDPDRVDRDPKPVAQHLPKPGLSRHPQRLR
ncbi:hypothetical protein GQR58_030060 [Nymphon striatum]|nr:hypothetical protein GQR58_030060 [Nymphon striatum]